MVFGEAYYEDGDVSGSISCEQLHFRLNPALQTTLGLVLTLTLDHFEEIAVFTPSIASLLFFEGHPVLGYHHAFSRSSYPSGTALLGEG